MKQFLKAAEYRIRMLRDWFLRLLQPAAFDPVTVPGPTWNESAPFLEKWEKAREIVVHRRTTSPPNRILIVPSDPDTLIGSKGDEAMILSCIYHYQALRPDVETVVTCRSDLAKESAKRLGLASRSIWESENILIDFSMALDDIQPEAVIILGADIMDGHYHPAVSAERFAFADLAIKAGVQTRVLGFSFNRNPTPELAQIIEHTDGGLVFGLRDPLSLKRWKAFTAKPAKLIADVAFLLPPTRTRDLGTDITGWIEKQQNEGRKVLGFNLHFMLLKSNTHGVQDMMRSIADVLVALKEQRISWLLIPHDRRGEESDIACLTHLKALLGEDENIFLIEPEIPASDIKGITSLLDGVVSGRMHLLIAALGMGTPVAAFGYQDKFEGLFAHFNIPEKYVRDVVSLVEQNELYGFLLEFSRKTPRLARKVRLRLPEIRALAEENLKDA